MVNYNSAFPVQSKPKKFSIASIMKLKLSTDCRLPKYLYAI